MNIFEPLKCSCQVCMRIIRPQSVAMHHELIDIMKHHSPIYSPPSWKNETSEEENEDNVTYNFHRIFLNYHLKPPRILAAVYSPDRASIAYINSLSRTFESTDFCSDIGHTLHINKTSDNSHTYDRIPNVPLNNPARRLYNMIPPVHTAFSLTTQDYQTTQIYDLTDIADQRNQVRRFIQSNQINNPLSYIYYIPTSLLTHILEYLYDNPDFNYIQLLKNHQYDSMCCS